MLNVPLHGLGVGGVIFLVCDREEDYGSGLFSSVTIPCSVYYRNRCLVPSPVLADVLRGAFMA